MLDVVTIINSLLQIYPTGQRFSEVTRCPFTFSEEVVHLVFERLQVFLVWNFAHLLHFWHTRWENNTHTHTQTGVTVKTGAHFITDCHQCDWTCLLQPEAEGPSITTECDKKRWQTVKTVLFTDCPLMFEEKNGFDDNFKLRSLTLTGWIHCESSAPVRCLWTDAELCESVPLIQSVTFVYHCGLWPVLGSKTFLNNVLLYFY